MKELNKNEDDKKVTNRFKNMLESVKLFFLTILKIEGIDKAGTAENIKKEMIFRGHSAWILMFSIIIASVGLNANSIPVIIGAMLISPLMSPIIAIGLSVGTIDLELLKRALKNFLVAVVISLITSTLYFWLSPIKEAQSELLARTTPTILDVFIALFGGFAGIVAGARSERGNVIPGVAIATALMPPLCTAGYGLATLQFNFFFGAFYLFFINTFFISLATVITVRLMKFERKHFLDLKVEKRIKNIMIFFSILVIIPSTIIFLNVIKQSRFNANAENYVLDIIKKSDNNLINYNFTYNDTTSFINLYFFGDNINDSLIISWTKELNNYKLISSNNIVSRYMLPDTTVLRIYHSASDKNLSNKEFNDLNEYLQKEIRVGVLEDIYKNNEKNLLEKDAKIELLQKEISKLTGGNFPIHQIKKELQIQYPNIEKFSFGSNLTLINDTLVDTIPTMLIYWKKGTSQNLKKQNIIVLSDWLKVRLNIDTILIYDIN